jgi:hypothetical protein
MDMFVPLLSLLMLIGSTKSAPPNQLGNIKASSQGASYKLVLYDTGKILLGYCH